MRRAYVGNRQFRRKATDEGPILQVTCVWVAVGGKDTHLLMLIISICDGLTSSILLFTRELFFFIEMEGKQQKKRWAFLWSAGLGGEGRIDVWFESLGLVSLVLSLLCLLAFLLRLRLCLAELFAASSVAAGAKRRVLGQKARARG